MIEKNSTVEGGTTPRASQAARRLTVMGVALAGAVAATSLVGATAAWADEVLTFKNRATNRCLDSNHDGRMYTLQCNGGNFQKWRVITLGSFNGTTYFQVVNEATRRCLTEEEGPWPGRVSTEECKYPHRQAWYNVKGNTHWAIEPTILPDTHARTNVLDSNANGDVYINGFNDGNFQVWDH